MLFVFYRIEKRFVVARQWISWEFSDSKNCNDRIYGAQVVCVRNVD